MRVIVLGGDGFCGWPTSLRLVAEGHEVLVIDNLVRRAIADELSAPSLTPIVPVSERIQAGNELGAGQIGFRYIDIACDYPGLSAAFAEFLPDAVVHFAEQRAAPYSMRSHTHRRYTVDNNVTATHNVLSAIVQECPEAHLVHLGTMGVYGYKDHGAPIPEGYLEVIPRGSEFSTEILFPTDPGSIYHMTKSLDQLLFQFYAKNDSVSITDLHQGIVWGIETEETASDPRLVNRFDYDGDFGTVLNRFLVEAAMNMALTVHGSGGQTRAFIHIQDTVRCIELALANPPKRGDRVRIRNQATETHSVIDLARTISEIANVDITFLENPRAEAVSNHLSIEESSFVNLGLQPIRLKDELMHDVHRLATTYKDRVRREVILCTTPWNAKRAAAIKRGRLGTLEPPTPD